MEKSLSCKRGTDNLQTFVSSNVSLQECKSNRLSDDSEQNINKEKRPGAARNILRGTGAFYAFVRFKETKSAI